MIDALFNQPNYLATKRLLDASTLRQQAIAGNLANLETPNYQRVDLSPSFEAELRNAMQSGDPKRISSVIPQISVDSTAVTMRRDGNTVDLETELVHMAENSMEHAVETKLLNGALLKMRMAITGRPA